MSSERMRRPSVARLRRVALPPATLTTSEPKTDESGAVTNVTLTLTPSPTYAAGLTSIAPPPPGSYWVGYVSDVQQYGTSAGPQTAVLMPTFTLPDGFVGPFTWRTVVGYRSSYFKTQPVTRPGAFPGAQSPIVGQSSVCVDFPDAGTINAAPSSLATGDPAITPPAAGTVVAGGSASPSFAALFSGDNPSGGTFSAVAATTVPGAAPAVMAPALAPAANSQTSLAVTFAVPAGTPPGSYDVSLTATVAGLSRAATGQITVTPAPVSKAAVAPVTKAASLTLAVRKTTLKVARKTGVTLSKRSTVSLVALQTRPKVSVTIRKTLLAGRKTVLLVKSKRFHKGKVTMTFKGGGVTRTAVVTLR